MAKSADLHQKRIAILTFSEVTRDPRIRRAAEIMLKRGHVVRVYSFQFDNLQVSESFMGIDVIRMPVSYCLDVNAFSSLFSNFMTTVNSLWPELCAVPKILSGPVLKQKLKSAIPSSLLPASRRCKRLLKDFRSTHSRNKESSILLPTRQSVVSNPGIDMAETRQCMQLNVDLFKAVGDWPTHVYANDLETLFAGVMLKSAYPVCLVYDAHEIWPHQWTENYRSAQFVGYYATMERLLLKYTDARITVGRGLAKYFEYAYASEPFHVVYNTPSVSALCSEEVLKRRNKKCGILYHGIYTAFRGLEEIIECVPELDDCRVAFRGIGEYERVLRSLACAKGLDARVEFLPPVKVYELIAAATEFDIGLLPFVNVCLNTNYVFANKMFEYMMAGLALACSDLVDQKEIVQEHQMGVVFDINNPRQVADQINHLIRSPDILADMRYNAWKAARDIYNWENSSKVFLKALESCNL